MSIVDTNTNTVVAYTSGQTKPMHGQRLASFNWKTSTDKDSLWFGLKRASKAVSVPVIADEVITSNLPLLIPHVRSYLAGVQDKIIRAAMETNDNLLHITNESIGIAAILEYLEDSDESGRLTKESVAAWFDASIADNLMVALGEKMGAGEEPTAAQSKQCEALVSQFKAKIAALAGGKTSYPQKLAMSLQKVVNLAPSDDVLAVRFSNRLQKMIDANESVELYDAL
jgi:hypothetical protein